MRPGQPPERPDLSRLRRYEELSGKTMLLGIGAMKCRTSWWNRYLATFDEVCVTPLKEVHYFDTKFPADPKTETTNPRIYNRLKTHIDRDDRIVINSQRRPHVRTTLDRVRMIYDDNGYFDHFARLIEPQHRFFSETTLSYAILPVEGMQLIRDMCATQDITLKIVFLVRDPVDRMWSHLRFMQERNPQNDVMANWREMIDNPRVAECGDYRHTIETLAQVFEPDQMHHTYYEDLREQESLTRFAASLGLTHGPEHHLDKVNETSVKLEMIEDIQAGLTELLAPQYAFCQTHFGEDYCRHWRRF